MKKPKSIAEYIKSFPSNTKKTLKKMREIVLSAAPEVEESVAYGMPAFKVEGKPLCYFAVFKNHLGFYPIPSAIKAFEKELIKYKMGKGSVQFPLDNPPFKLIKKMVAFRRKEIIRSIRQKSKKIK